jgi:hypothetical protein
MDFIAHGLGASLPRAPDDRWSRIGSTGRIGGSNGERLVRDLPDWLPWNEVRRNAATYLVLIPFPGIHDAIYNQGIQDLGFVGDDNPTPDLSSR